MAEDGLSSSLVLSFVFFPFLLLSLDYLRQWVFLFELSQYRLHTSHCVFGFLPVGNWQEMQLLALLSH